MSHAADSGRTVRLPGTPLEEHWAAVLGSPAPGPCRLCRKRRRAAICERREASVEFTKQFEPGSLKWNQPTRAFVCKDCCIANLDGHRCIWWDFCWSI